MCAERNSEDDESESEYEDCNESEVESLYEDTTTEYDTEGRVMEHICMDPRPARVSALRVDQGILEVDCDRTWLEYIEAINHEQAGLMPPESTTMFSVGAPSELCPPGETDPSSEGSDFNSESEVSSDNDPEIPKPPTTRRTKGDLPVHLRRKKLKGKHKSPTSEQEKQKKPQDLPKHFTKFKKRDRIVVLVGAKRQGQASEPIEGPAKVKEINLEREGEKPRPVFIAEDLTEQEEANLTNLLREYIDVFAWSLDELQGVDPRVVTHHIPMVLKAFPVNQWPYPINLKHSHAVKEEIDKLMRAGFIYEIEHRD